MAKIEDFPPQAAPVVNSGGSGAVKVNTRAHITDQMLQRQEGQSLTEGWPLQGRAGSAHVLAWGAQQLARWV